MRYRCHPAPVFFAAFAAATVLASLYAPSLADEIEEYRAFRTELVELWNAEKYEEAAEIIDGNFERFPSQVWKMSYNMAAVCAHLEDYDRGMEYLERAHEKGQWFSTWAFGGELWEPYREIERFDEFIARNEEFRAEAQKTAQMKIEISLPDSFEAQETFPLFIALHGGGENIDAFRPHWRSEIMDSEFIVAFVQSSQVVSMDGFSWEDQETTMKEVREAYDRVCAEYPVDTSEVIVGGFSSGGYGSLVVTFFEAVPVDGFVILCPPMPDNITEAETAGARERGVRGTIMTTELDRRVPDQRRMADLFRDTGLQYQFILTPDIGHWYPEELPEMIDQAIAHIRNR